jgi:outer membrane protein assembly factor BamB
MADGQKQAGQGLCHGGVGGSLQPYRRPAEPGRRQALRGTPGWDDSDANAALSRANLAENILTPAAVTKVKHLRNLTPPRLPHRGCDGAATTPLPTGGSVYAVGGGRLSKYNPATGKLLWRSNPDRRFDEVYQSLSISANLVLVAGFFCGSESDPGGAVTAFNASTGAQVWSAQPADGLIQTVVVGTSYVVTTGEAAGADGYNIEVLDLSDGKNAWNSFPGCFAPDADQVPPVVVDEVVMGYGCNSLDDPVLEGMSLATGTVLWTLPATGWIPQRGDLAGSAGAHLYATDPAGTVDDLNPLTGRVEYSLSRAVSVLAVDTSHVYATCGASGRYVCAYSIGTGTLDWENKTVPAGTVLAAEADGVLYLDSGEALNAATGKAIKQIWSSAQPATWLAVGDGRIAEVPAGSAAVDLYGLPGS